MLTLKRPMNLIDKKYMYEFYGEEYSIDKLSRLKVKKLYKLEDKKIVEKYLFNILNDWIQLHYKEDLQFSSALRKKIRKLGLKLNLVEKDKLLVLDERIFSIDRHIKELEVNTELGNKEHVGAKFTNAYLYKKGDLVCRGDLLISNKRLIIKTDTEETSFYYSKSKVITSDDGILIPKGDFKIKIHDQPTLKNTFENIKRRKVKKYEI